MFVKLLLLTANVFLLVFGRQHRLFCCVFNSKWNFPRFRAGPDMPIDFSRSTEWLDGDTFGLSRVAFKNFCRSCRWLVRSVFLWLTLSISSFNFLLKTTYLVEEFIFLHLCLNTVEFAMEFSDKIFSFALQPSHCSDFGLVFFDHLFVVGRLVLSG